MKSLSTVALLAALALVGITLASPEAFAQGDALKCSQRNTACIQRCRPGNTNCITRCANLMNKCMGVGRPPALPRAPKMPQ